MGIAIKKLEANDISSFNEFLETDRTQLPNLKLSSLVEPHEDIAVVAGKRGRRSLDGFAQRYNFVVGEYGGNIISLSRHEPVRMSDNKSYIFSGYAIYNGKMFIGMDEMAQATDDIRPVNGCYGEFNSCVIGYDSIHLSSDYFGMIPWFYFDNDEVFAASNNYHLLLLVLAELGVKLSMNIPRSRVNAITSGYTYGSAFSADLDVAGCRMNLSYEEISYSSADGVRLEPTTLWDLVSDKNEWDEAVYEDCINKARDELLTNCRAVFEHPKFTKIVVDVSGGFDSRVVFACACSMPERLKKKLYTYTRRSGTKDDVEIAAAVTNMFDFPKHNYGNTDTSSLYDASGDINLASVSRNLGIFSVNPYLYTAKYNDYKTLELTGGIGDITLGYQRIRGEVDFSLGDKRLMARLGGCYLHNSVDELQGVFRDQERIIFNTLDKYSFCDCLFKKFHMLYIDFRNRLNFGSGHNIENNNMRIPMVASKYALKAKWMHFNRFTDNQIPDEKVSFDVLAAIDPIFTVLPFASNNDNVIPKPERLLKPYRLKVEPDFTVHPGPKAENAEGLYKNKAVEYMDNIDIAEQMLLHIYDYSAEYQPVCLGLYKVLQLFRQQPEDATSGHGRETVRKIYDLYYQIRLVEAACSK